MVLSFTALWSSYFLWKVFFSWNRGMQQKALSPHLHAGLIYPVDDSDRLGPHSTNLDIKVIHARHTPASGPLHLLFP